MSEEFGGHIPEEWLERYALHQLPERQVETLEEHLLVCALCQQKLDGVDEYVGVVKMAARAELRKPPARSPGRLAGLLKGPPPGPALAALFTALVLATALEWNRYGERRPVAAETEVSLSARRGGTAALLAHARAGARLALRLDATEVARPAGYRLELVNASGERVWETGLPGADLQLRAAVPVPLSAGRYWVRLYDAAAPGTLLREYGLEIGGPDL